MAADGFDGREGEFAVMDDNMNQGNTDAAATLSGHPAEGDILHIGKAIYEAQQQWLLSEARAIRAGTERSKKSMGYVVGLAAISAMKAFVPSA